MAAPPAGAGLPSPDSVSAAGSGCAWPQPCWLLRRLRNVGSQGDAWHMGTRGLLPLSPAPGAQLLDRCSVHCVWPVNGTLFMEPPGAGVRLYPALAIPGTFRNTGRELEFPTGL